MHPIAIRPAILVPLLALGLTGCAWFAPRHAAPVGVRPVAANAATPGALADDGLYLDARSAIMRRDYATALDLLQAANTRSANDVRVLNAFGVVYDKLGRFDLSARYYAWAAALDPTSPIIANNVRYSGILRGGQAADTALAQASPAPQPPADTGETLYNEALAAISGGDNARALELLYAARSRKADDVRVLNALGVVNSRLGRFDLSERYYRQAAQLDPGSPVLANNQAVSRLLRARPVAAHDAPAMVVATAPSQAPGQPPRTPQ